MPIDEANKQFLDYQQAVFKSLESDEEYHRAIENFLKSSSELEMTEKNCEEQNTFLT